MTLSAKLFLIRPMGGRTNGPPMFQDESTAFAFLVAILLYLFWRRAYY